MVRLGWLLTASLMLFPAARARAEIESELIKQGIAAYNDLEYARAVALLRKGLEETLTREEKLATYQTLAFAHVALHQTGAAMVDFENLLQIDAAFELDRTISPRVRAVFEEAKARVATGRGLEGASLGHGLPTLSPQLSPPRLKEGQSLDVSVSYPGGVAARFELFYRTRGATVFSKLSVKGDATSNFAAVIPGMDVHAPALEYYAAVLDEGGASIAKVGSLGQPVAVNVEARKRPVYTRAWFWGVIGGVAVAGAGVALAVTLTRSSVGPSTPATVTIQPQ
jgi:hypothetical protein